MDRPANALLRAMSAEDFEQLRPHLRPIALELGDIVHGPGDPVERVVWPEIGLLSVVASSFEGRSVETSMVGREGASALVEACGSGVSFMTVLVQVEGRAVSAPASACRAVADRSVAFRNLVTRYAEAMLAEARQSVVCQAMHEAEARCARWIMETRDRSGLTGSLPLTQEYLAAMLGVQRTTVTPIASALQQRGLIRYSRGRIDVLEPERLDAVACRCRRAITEHRERVSPAA